jgi:hypothetical protein
VIDGWVRLARRAVRAEILVGKDTHLADFVFCHGSCYVAFVLEDEQRGTHETLGDC